MKRIIAMTACLILILSTFTGCSPSGQDQLVGKWKATADLEVAIQTMLAKADPSLSGHIDIPAFKVDITITFEQDGTYKCTVDEEALATGTEQMMQALSTALATYLQQETGMTIEELLIVRGVTMEELMDQWFSSDMAYTLQGYLASSGTYELDHDELILTDKNGFVIYEFDCVVDKKTIKFTACNGAGLMAGLMPITFTKQ